MVILQNTIEIPLLPSGRRIQAGTLLECVVTVSQNDFRMQKTKINLKNNSTTTFYNVLASERLHVVTFLYLNTNIHTLRLENLKNAIIALPVAYYSFSNTYKNTGCASKHWNIVITKTGQTNKTARL